jgi:uncharacterized protein
MGSGLIRLLTLLLLIGGAWLLYKRVRKLFDQTFLSERKPDERLQVQMVRCAYCGLHVPEHEAVPDSEGKTYCCPEHRRLSGNG